jgi:hypothetical protein
LVVVAATGTATVLQVVPPTVTVKVAAVGITVVTRTDTANTTAPAGICIDVVLVGEAAIVNSSSDWIMVAACWWVGAVPIIVGSELTPKTKAANPVPPVFEMFALDVLLAAIAKPFESVYVCPVGVVKPPALVTNPANPTLNLLALFTSASIKFPDALVAGLINKSVRAEVVPPTDCVVTPVRTVVPEDVNVVPTVSVAGAELATRFAIVTFFVVEEFTMGTTSVEAGLVTALKSEILLSAIVISLENYVTAVFLQ